MKQVVDRLFILLFLTLGLALTACEPITVEEPEKSDKASIIRLGFSRDSNPGLTGNTSAVEANGYYFISVNEGADRARLVPALEISAGATATIDGQPYTAGTAYDFSGNVQTIRVTSESETRHAEYKVVVKYGNPYIDNKVYEFMHEFNIPGVSISVMKGTEIKYSSGYGFASVAQESRVTPDHLFRMATFSVIAIITLETASNDALALFKTVMFSLTALSL